MPVTFTPIVPQVAWVTKPGTRIRLLAAPSAASGDGSNGEHPSGEKGYIHAAKPPTCAPVTARATTLRTAVAVLSLVSPMALTW